MVGMGLLSLAILLPALTGLMTLFIPRSAPGAAESHG